MLGIKLNLATLNKAYMEQRSDLKREQAKSATYAVEKQNLKNCLVGVKQALEATQDSLNQKQNLMQEALTQLEHIKTKQDGILGEKEELSQRVQDLEGQVSEAREGKAGAEDRVKELERQMQDCEKENQELRRRIELISSLRVGHQQQKSENSAGAASGEVDECTLAGRSSARVDSAWSQA